MRIISKMYRQQNRFSARYSNIEQCPIPFNNLLTEVWKMFEKTNHSIERQYNNKKKKYKELKCFLQISQTFEANMIDKIQNRNIFDGDWHCHAAWNWIRWIGRFWNLLKRMNAMNQMGMKMPKKNPFENSSNNNNIIRSIRCISLLIIITNGHSFSLIMFSFLLWRIFHRFS